MSPPFALVEASGSPQQLGVAYGMAVSDKVAAAVSEYRRLVEATGLSGRSLLHALGTKLAVLEKALPEVWTELVSLSSGACVTVEDAMLLNARSELLSLGWPELPPVELPDLEWPQDTNYTGECTSMAVAGSRTGRGALAAQTWDWFPRFGELSVVLKAKPDKGPARLTFCESGQLAKIGLNSAGLAVGINFLDCPRREAQESLLGVPVHLLVRAVLGTDGIDEAVALLRSLPRGGAVNLVLAEASGRVVDVEVSPARVTVIEPLDGFVTHANDFERELGPGSPRPCRSARARRLLGPDRRVDKDVLFSVLRDHSGDAEPICSHPGLGHVAGLSWATSSVAAFVLDPAAGTVWASAGPPCSSAASAYTINAP